MSDIRPETGVCYYPEHWPEDLWEKDAKAWSRLASHGFVLLNFHGLRWSLRMVFTISRGLIVL